MVLRSLRRLISLFVVIQLLGCGPSPKDEPPLHEAAKNGDIEDVRELLDAGIDVNSLNSEGATPLHWAAFKGHKEAFKKHAQRKPSDAGGDVGIDSSGVDLSGSSD